MGLSNFPSPAEGVLPILVMNTLLSVAILKNLLKSLVEIIGAVTASSRRSSSWEEDPPETDIRRRVSITQFKSLYEVAGPTTSGGCQAVECSVCLNRFEEEEEVSELSCKHFFHRSCLDKWFDNHHSTCPLCRSIY